MVFFFRLLLVCENYVIFSVFLRPFQIGAHELGFLCACVNREQWHTFSAPKHTEHVIALFTSAVEISLISVAFKILNFLWNFQKNSFKNGISVFNRATKNDEFLKATTMWHFSHHFHVKASQIACVIHLLASFSLSQYQSYMCQPGYLNAFFTNLSVEFWQEFGDRKFGGAIIFTAWNWHRDATTIGFAIDLYAIGWQRPSIGWTRLVWHGFNPLLMKTTVWNPIFRSYSLQFSAVSCTKSH